MRMLVFFDLPTETREDRREYVRFRKLLIRNGFLMMQESVYCKIALNATVVELTADKLRKEKPRQGLVQLLTVTERQFQKMEYLVGSYKGDVIHTDERYIEI